jgi:hypothetical protein
VTDGLVGRAFEDEVLVDGFVAGAQDLSLQLLAELLQTLTW